MGYIVGRGTKNVGKAVGNAVAESEDGEVVGVTEGETLLGIREIGAFVSDAVGKYEDGCNDGYFVGTGKVGNEEIELPATIEGALLGIAELLEGQAFAAPLICSDVDAVMSPIKLKL